MHNTWENGADKKGWKMLLESPFLLSNLQLRKLLRLEASTPHSRVFPDKRRIFYLMTLPMTAGMLAEVLGYLTHSGLKHHNVTTLLQAIKPHTDPTTADTPIFLRHVGTTACGKAWLRHLADLLNIPRTFLGAF
jgi:hypothetical protein